MIHEYLNDILEMDLDEAQRYLITLLEQEPETFEALHGSIQASDFLEELRNEEHNGYKMYPDL